MTTSFGSICLGSLIVAFIKTIKYFVQHGRRSNNEFARACAVCILSCIDSIVQYFNMYAFTQVAIYGKSFCEAGKATWDLLKSRGLDAIINDDLISGVIIFGSLIGAMVVGAVGLIIGKYTYGYSENYGIFVLVGVLIGFAMIVSCMEVIESSVAALFVCYAEDPQALAETKPDVNARLTAAFSEFYGGVLISHAVVPRV